MPAVWQAQSIGSADLVFCLQVRGKRIAMTAAAIHGIANDFASGFAPPHATIGTRRHVLPYKSDDLALMIKIIGLSLEDTNNAPIWCALKKSEKIDAKRRESILDAYDSVTGARLNDPQAGQDAWVKIMDAAALTNDTKIQIAQTNVRLK